MRLLRLKTILQRIFQHVVSITAVVHLEDKRIAVGVAVVLAYCFSFAMGYFLEKPQALPFTPYQNYIEFKMHPRPSTGAQRLEISHEQFRKERKR